MSGDANRVNTPFEIFLAWSDVTLHVPLEKSALEILLQAGMPISPGCLSGACGECATDFVEGDVVHKDSCLNAVERAHKFCPCVSRARSRIVLAF